MIKGSKESSLVLSSYDEGNALQFDTYFVQGKIRLNEQPRHGNFKPHINRFVMLLILECNLSNLVKLQFCT